MYCDPVLWSKHLQVEMDEEECVDGLIVITFCC